MKLVSLVTLFVLSAFVASASAQTQFDAIPGEITYAKLPDAPVTLSVVGTDRAPLRTVYTIENQSDKVIWGMLVSGLPGTSAPTALANINLAKGAKMHEGSRLVKFDGSVKKWEVGVDSVLFRDGTIWGPSALPDSAYLRGIRDGMKMRAAEIRKLWNAGDEPALRRSISTVGPDEAMIPPPGRLRDGIVYGYNWASNEFHFNFQDHGDISGLLARLVEMEQMLGIPTDEKSKYILRRYYRAGEPVKILAVKHHDLILDIDEAVRIEGDWIGDIEVMLRNDSGKIIKHISLNVEFPETAENGDMIMSAMTWGRNQLGYLAPGTADPVAPGATVKLTWAGRCESVKRMVGSARPIESLRRIRLALSLVVYDDGTGWLRGQAVRPDPNNPLAWVPLADGK